MKKRMNSRWKTTLAVCFAVIAAVLIAVPSVLSVLYYRNWQDTRGRLESLLSEMVVPADETDTTDSFSKVTKPPHAEPNTDPESPAYQSLYPDFYAPQPLECREMKDKAVYLTFDDGPSPVTDSILDTLAAYQVKATFFVVGQGDETSVNRMKRMVAEGHTIGMHTSTHNYRQMYTSVESFLADEYAVFTILRDRVGYVPTAFRFPGGSINAYNGDIYQEIIAEMTRRGFVGFDWNMSTGDAEANSVPVNTLIQNVSNQLPGTNRGILLMHDARAKGTTAEALPHIIETVRAQGYSLEAIDSKTKPLLFGYRDYKK